MVEPVVMIFYKGNHTICSACISDIKSFLHPIEKEFVKQADCSHLAMFVSTFLFDKYAGSDATGINEEGLLLRKRRPRSHSGDANLDIIHYKSFPVEYDSKENIDKNYNGSLYNYFR